MSWKLSWWSQEAQNKSHSVSVSPPSTSQPSLSPKPLPPRGWASASLPPAPQHYNSAVLTVGSLGSRTLLAFLVSLLVRLPLSLFFLISLHSWAWPCLVCWPASVWTLPDASACSPPSSYNKAFFSATPRTDLVLICHSVTSFLRAAPSLVTISSAKSLIFWLIDWLFLVLFLHNLCPTKVLGTV